MDGPASRGDKRMSQVPAASVVAIPAPSVTVIKPVPPIDPRTPPSFDRRRVRRWMIVVSLLLLAAYLLLENPYWVPGGDSDFYVAAARSMARGQGFLYNNLPIAISPPGWPWVMAQVMKVSPTFLALKLTTLLSMFGSLVIGYYIALRFLRPSAAAWATVLAGLLMPVYSLTYFLHSEAVYCLLSAVALLLSLRIREGRGGGLHIAALLAICIALPLIRWAGLFQLLPIAAVLLSGPRTLPLAKRHWKTALACVLVIGCTFVAGKRALKLSDEQLKDIVAAGGAGGPDDVPIVEAGEAKSDDVLKGPEDKNKSLVREYAERVGQSGKWFAWLLWQPTRFVEFSKPLAILVAVGGWGVIALLAYLAVNEAKRGEWLWVSLALYTGGICIGWNNVNSRYFVPLAPLIVVGLSLATRRLGERFPAKTFDLWKWLRRGMVYSILACNLAMYGVDVIVMRSRNFYETFEAGQHKDLIAAAWYLTQSLPPAPATQPSTSPATQVAATSPASQPLLGPAHRLIDTKLLVNQRYENLGRAKDSKAGTRAMVLLTDRVVQPLDGRITKVVRPTPNPDPTKLPYSSKFIRPIRERRAEWYFAQDKVVPWRVWHFRVPEFLYRKFAKVQPNETIVPSSGWKLYRFDRVNMSFTEYPFPPVENWPTRVPGM